MMRWCFGAPVLLLVLGVGPAAAQYDVPGVRPQANRPPGDPKPVYKYELKPENGEFLVCVRSFIGKTHRENDAKERAEGLAEWIRTECRLYAFVYARGWVLRREQEKEKETVIAAIRKYYEPMGYTEEQIQNVIRKDVKFARLPDDYAVYVAPGKGSLKTSEDAGEFAKYVQKLPCPPADFCDAVVVGASSSDVARAQGEARNPFPTALPGRNPTLPRKEVTTATRPKADDFLMSLNSGQKYSLINQTKKDFTLVVQTYGGKFGQVYKPGEVKLVGGTKSDGEMLERAAQQATALCEVLRQQKKPSLDAYVLHTRFESFVCIGEYDSKDDPELQRLAGMMAHMAIRDDKGQVIETLMDKPLPAMIPRP
ncbi:MAG TPA: hypothetical protein VHR66_22690 [Gemmataceae bacterium]|jgi:hypothetical protein|nr:hypothetical protein [Gemmataceae bacterium]